MADDADTLQDESVQLRFWSKVDRRGPDECWPWTGSIIKKDGRGTLWAGGKNITAPRISLFLNVGQPPEGKTFACHTCDNPNCVNPSHLWWGDVRDNTHDARDKGRLSGMAQTHCARGHEFTPENTAIYKSAKGWRMRKCKQCKRLFAARYSHKKHKQNGRRSQELIELVAREPIRSGEHRKDDHG